MAGKNTAVFGIFKTKADAENCVGALRDNGFRVEDISVLLPENLGSKDLKTEKATKTPEGVTTGATTGAVIGGALGLLAGIGALAIPGLGPFIAAGPIVATLAGIGAGGTIGGLTGALIGMGMPEYEAKRYEGRVREGGILLSVHCDNSEWTRKAKDMLQRVGASDVSSTGESGADFAKSDRPMPRGIEGDEDYAGDFRLHYERTFVATGVPFEQYSPAYEYGYQMAGEPRYRGRNFNDVEGDLRRDYERAHPNSTWEKMKDAVRYGWDRLTGKGARTARR
jgi:hypothetical protein